VIRRTEINLEKGMGSSVVKKSPGGILRALAKNIRIRGKSWRSAQRKREKGRGFREGKSVREDRRGKKSPKEGLR